jgi:hypothetical protein
MTIHQIRRWADEGGYSARCRCSWSITWPTREQRDRDADVHELDDSVLIADVPSDPDYDEARIRREAERVRAVNELDQPEVWDQG